MAHSKVLPTLLAALSLTAACQGTPGSRIAADPRGSARPSPKTVAPAPDQIATLTGKVKLISDVGVAVISNHGGGVIGEHGAGIVANNGGSYRLSQAAPESLLADAEITVHDAGGAPVLGPDGKPIATRSDRQGAYKLTAALPAGNLVLRIKLWKGGELSALLARGVRQLDIDTASTLGAAYVLETYVKRDQAVLDRLPADEATALQARLAAARTLLPPGPPSYEPKAMAAATADLRAKDPEVARALERIEALLLLGQKDLGSGRKATEVALTYPLGVHRDARGNIYVAEQLGRIRRIAPDGTVRLYAGLGGTPETGVAELGELYHLVGEPDGTLWFYEAAGHRIRRLTPAGAIETMAGGGGERGEARKAAELRLRGRMQFALAPDGSLVLADDEELSGDGEPSRILRVARDGTVSSLAFPGVEDVDFNGVAVDPDGAVYVVVTPDGTSITDAHDAETGAIWRRSPEGAWTKLLDLGTTKSKVSLAAPAPGRLLFNDSHFSISELGPDGKLRKRTTTTGNPNGLWAGPDGSVLYAQANSHVVHQLDAQDRATHVAGVRQGGAAGLAAGLSLNGPLGLAFDPSGRLLISEAGSRVVRRLDGDRLVSVLGEEQAPERLADGRLNSPGALAVHGGELYVLELQHAILKRIGKDRIQHVVAGLHRFENEGREPKSDGRSLPALDYGFQRPLGLAVDPQGRPVIADVALHVIVRLEPDGRLVVLAGATSGDAARRAGDEGDGGKAEDARLSSPSALAFDSKGNLYVADALNGRIRRITPDGRIETYAGVPIVAALARVSENRPDTGPVAAKEAVLVAPFALCFDRADNLYVAELGTALGHKLGTAGALLDGLPRIGASIRKITPAGRATIVAGRGSRVLSGEGGDDALVSPSAMVLDPDGNLIVADSGLNQVRRIPREALGD